MEHRREEPEGKGEDFEASGHLCTFAAKLTLMLKGGVEGALQTADMMLEKYFDIPSLAEETPKG